MKQDTLRLTRKDFLGASATGSILFLLQACGGGGGDAAPAPASGTPQGLTCGASNITGNHGHSLTLTTDQLNSATDLTLNIQGTATHNHTIVLSVAQLATLKAKGSVDVTSSTDFQHNHTVTAACA